MKALDGISFKAYGGEVLAFLGENGAGKSTLLKVLNGDYQPNEGKYILDGEEKHFRTPHEAIEAGISVIYQERQILMELSVAENIFLGRMPVNRFGVIDTRRANKMAAEIIKEFGMPIKPSTKVKDLNIAHQQMVEIMKACSRENLKVICFDEPTASLTDDEIEILFKIIEKLKNEGKIVIYVSHRMSELQKITDKVAIFKDGTYVDTVVTKEVPEQQLIKTSILSLIGGDKLVLLLAIVLVFVLFTILNPNYLSVTNVINILMAASLIGMVAIGHTYLIIAKQNDLSPGSLAAMSGVVVALLLQRGLPIPVAILVTMAVGALVGVFNAWIWRW